MLLFLCCNFDHACKLLLFPQPSVVAPPPSVAAPQQPVQVPMYESLHPLQKHHSFSYASPAVPLLGGHGAEKVLGSPKGSYYAPSQQQQLQTTTNSVSAAGNGTSATSRASAYEIQSYLLGDSAKPEMTTYLPHASSADPLDTAGRDARAYSSLFCISYF